MGKYIWCGEYNNNYKYIILGCFFNILMNIIFGLEMYSFHNPLLIFPSEMQNILIKHWTIYEIFKYIGVFIFACVLHKIESFTFRKELTIHRSTCSSSKRKTYQTIIVFNDSQDEINNISILNFIFIITLYVSITYLSDLANQFELIIFDFWMFELLVISYLNSKMFKVKLYSHQKCAIYFNSFICLLFRLLVFFLSFSFQDKSNESNGKSLFEISNWFIVIGLIIYALIITIRAYSYTKIKWFIDLEYISPTKILIYIGFIGILVTSISCIIETYLECNPILNACEIINPDNSSKYLENFFIYNKNISNLQTKEEIIYEICVILFGMISSYFAIYFDILIIKYLTPVHFIFYSSIYYFILKLLSLFNNKILNGYYFNGEASEDNMKFYIFILDISGNFLAFFGFLVYLEIIELGFCRLNYNLRKYIRERGESDLEEIYDIDDMSLFNEKSEDGQNEENSTILYTLS